MMQKILILGGGFAGIETALRLRQNLPKNEIILVSDDDCFTFSPLLYEVAAGELSEADACILIPYLTKKHRIIYYRDSAKKILPKEKVVITNNFEKISFDLLVLAVGALTNYSGIEGKEKAFALKNKEDAEKIFERISNCIEQNKPHHFVVCGAGLTGIEFATTLKDHIDYICAKNGFNRKNFRITILHGPNKILPNLPEKASSLVQDYLSKVGIKVVCNFYTKKIFNKKVVSKDGKEFSYDTIIWAGGIRTHDLIINSSLPYSGMHGERGAPGGGLLVNSFMQSTKYPFIFGLGDCACVLGNENVQKTAQNAIEQSKVVTKNIIALLKNSKMVQYKTKIGKFYCALGKNNALYVCDKKILVGKRIRFEKEKQETNYVKRLSNTNKPSNGIYKFL